MITTPALQAAMCAEEACAIKVSCGDEHVPTKPKYMDKRTRDALLESIAHWRRMEADETALSEGTSSASCALCLHS